MSHRGPHIFEALFDTMLRHLALLDALGIDKTPKHHLWTHLVYRSHAYARARVCVVITYLCVVCLI